MVFKIIPHLDDDASTIDIQYTNNLYGSWSTLIAEDPISTYPKSFNDNNVTSDTYLRFRVKNIAGLYTDWSKEYKPLNSETPEPSSTLCFVYGRLRDKKSQDPLNSPIIVFRVTGGVASGGTPDILEKTIEADNYGWFGVYLTPGRVYEVECLEASIKRTITIPAAVSVRFSTL